MQSFRRAASIADSARMACRFFGGIFVLMGVLGGFGDKYHNLMHLVWGALALGVGFLGTTVARRFCIASGAFYLTLSALGLTIGNPAMHRAWYFGPMLLHTGDHIFHVVLSSIFLAMGLVSGRQLVHHPSQAQRFVTGFAGQKVPTGGTQRGSSRGRGRLAGVFTVDARSDTGLALALFPCTVVVDAKRTLKTAPRQPSEGRARAERSVAFPVEAGDGLFSFVGGPSGSFLIRRLSQMAISAQWMATRRIGY